MKLSIGSFGLVGLLALDVFTSPQDAEAKGCINPNAPGGGNLAFNASQGRCAR